LLTIKEINLGSEKEHRVVDMASVVSGLAGDEAVAGHIERGDRDVLDGLLSSIGKRLLGYELQTGFGGWAEEYAWMVCGEMGRCKWEYGIFSA
jgi:UDP-glucose 4-epimerase